ncbi:MAG: DNA gyrase inhibitor YacG [Pirellulales bacterium]|nr:DNA gyrase inhibitor YacG [Pirellulales bacterium]
MSLSKCPVCEITFDSESSEAMPFCCPRCKQIDLSRWLDERYSLPIERPDDAEKNSADAGDD